jgi:hypothetical protein
MADKSQAESTPIAVDIRGAARLLSISTRSVARLVVKGVLPSVKLNSRRLFLVESLKSVLASQQEEQAAGLK